MASDSSSLALPYDNLLKILLIGDSDCHKRQMLQNYMGLEEYSDTTTLGIAIISS